MPTRLQSIILVRVRVHSGTSTVELDGRGTLRDLFVKALQQRHQLGIVHLSRQLTHLRHPTHHSLDHLRLFRFADLQGVHWKAIRYGISQRMARYVPGGMTHIGLLLLGPAPATGSSVSSPPVVAFGLPVPAVAQHLHRRRPGGHQKIQD